MRARQSDKGTSGKLLDWYDTERRRLPWRAEPGKMPDPYRVWLSEIMLQQTQVTTVIPYFESFTARWPTVGDLAAAPLDDVLHAWQGLGYYARARNLHGCARVVANELGGEFPDTEEGLLGLPGVGAYTAAAVAAIAFGRKTAAVDGNVVRVVSRLFAIETPLPALRNEVSTRLMPMVPADRPGDFAQALMDLGATVCTPRNPACPDCPLRTDCKAGPSGEAGRLPVRAPKREKPTRFGVVFWLERKGDGAVLLRRRPERGLLGGMMEFPSTGWRETPWRDDEARIQAPAKADWRPATGRVRHTFTHFHLELTVWRAATTEPPNDGVWCRPADFGNRALPTVMKKVADTARNS